MGSKTKSSKRKGTRSSKKKGTSSKSAGAFATVVDQNEDLKEQPSVAESSIDSKANESKAVVDTTKNKKKTVQEDDELNTTLAEHGEAPPVPKTSESPPASEEKVQVQPEPVSEPVAETEDKDGEDEKKESAASKKRKKRQKQKEKKRAASTEVKEGKEEEAKKLPKGIHIPEVKEGKEEEAKKLPKGIHIPDGIVRKILARSPVKAILRFISVHTSWKSIISYKGFPSYHLKHRPSLILFRYGIKQPERTEHYCLCEELDVDFPRTRLKEFDCPFRSSDVRNPARIVGSCNGLVCLTDYETNTEAAVWNPHIRKIVQILPPFHTGKWKSSLVHVGFGFDPDDKDYKLVRITSAKDSLPLVQLYALSTGYWKEVRHDLFFQFDSHYLEAGVHVDGVLYWLATCLKKQAIVSFSLSSEVFNYMPIPVDHSFLQQLVQQRPSVALSSCCKGLLSLVFSDDDCVTIWAMKEGSWMKQVTVDPSSHMRRLYLFKILSFQDSRLLFTAVDRGVIDKESLFRFDLATREEVELMVVYEWPLFHLDANHMESLVLLH